MTATTTPAFGQNATMDQFLLDMFNTALEGGIGYWSVCKVYHWTKPDSDFIEDPEGFHAVIDPAEDPDDFPADTRIDRTVMARGLQRLAEGPVEGLHDSYRAPLVVSYQLALAGTDPFDKISTLDADSADWIVQVGLFGKVVYG